MDYYRTALHNVLKAKGCSIPESTNPESTRKIAPNPVQTPAVAPEPPTSPPNGLHGSDGASMPGRPSRPVGSHTEGELEIGGL